MNIKNLLPGFLAASALISVYSSPQALAQYKGAVTEFDQRIPSNYQSQQPTAAQTRPPVTIPAGMAINENGELYTPNINGVPISPVVPRAGLNKNGFDPFGNAYNQFTTPEMNYRLYPQGQPTVQAQPQVQMQPQAHGQQQTQAQQLQAQAQQLQAQAQLLQAQAQQLQAQGQQPAQFQPQPPAQMASQPQVAPQGFMSAPGAPAAGAAQFNPNQSSFNSLSKNISPLMNSLVKSGLKSSLLKGGSSSLLKNIMK